MAQNQQVKPSFKAPEGRYVLHNERGSICQFVPTRPLRLTFVTIQHLGSSHSYIIYNVLDTLAFCHYSGVDKQPLRQVLVGQGASGAVIYPTCHDHHPSPDNMDLVVGLSSGDVVVGSVKAQLQGSANNSKLLDLLHFNPEGAVDSSRAVSVAWIPGTNASLFAAAHQSGNIYLYQPQSAVAAAAAASSDSSPRSGKGLAGVPRPSLTIPACQGGLTSMAISPDGTSLASTSKQGVLYVHNLNTGALLTGFKSHYGGLTCCAWSHDSHYVATGGEDDLVCVYGVIERAVVFWGEGHTSWVTQVAFDRWEGETSTSGSGEATLRSHHPGPQQTRYRIASVGQDCQLLLWDFVVEEDEYRESLDASSNWRERQETYPGAVHRRTHSNPHANGGQLSSSGTGGSGDFALKVGRGLAAPLPHEITPPVKRSEMFFSTPVMTQIVHSEPCSDILFKREAVYTGCFCGQIRCWRRPERLPSSSARGPSLGSSSGASRQSSLVNDEQ